jgi:hypothetical protein
MSYGMQRLNVAEVSAAAKFALVKNQKSRFSGKRDFN